MATPATNNRRAAATKRSTSAKKGQATRARAATRTQARTTKRSAQRTAATAERQAENRLDQVTGLAGRLTLTGVGAALTARDRVTQGYEYLRSTYGDGDSVQRQLKKFEKRGVTGRSRVERRVKRTRTSVERELRQRRVQVTREAKQARRNVERQVKPLTSQFDLVSAQLENVVQTGATVGQKAVAVAAERVASVA
jgi:hypothetical protein